MIENQKRLKENRNKKMKDIMFNTEFDRFMIFLFSNKTVLFQDFLDSTSIYFDTFIKKTCKKEKLKFIAGKFLMKKECSAEIHLIVELYFQNSNQQWILKKKEGDVTYDHFTDWEIAPELKQLEIEQKIEFPIDPPDDMR